MALHGSPLFLNLSSVYCACLCMHRAAICSTLPSDDYCLSMAANHFDRSHQHAVACFHPDSGPVLVHFCCCCCLPHWSHQPRCHTSPDHPTLKRTRWPQPPAGALAAPCQSADILRSSVRAPTTARQSVLAYEAGMSTWAEEANVEAVILLFKLLHFETSFVLGAHAADEGLRRSE